MNKKQVKISVLLILIGFCMGSADIVPGISGGTIALIAGVYQDLLKSISSFNITALKLLFQRRFVQLSQHVSLSFLVPLGIGILLAIVVMAKVISFFLQTYPIWTWSLFFGIIGASVYFLICASSSFKWYFSLAFCIGAVFGFVLVNIVPIETPNTPLFFVLSGAIAICAMLLPGISGSFMLLLLGKYEVILTDVKDLFVFNSVGIAKYDLVYLLLGFVIGILVFSRLLRFLLHNYYDITMFTLAGIILGSMRRLWPWKEVLKQKIVHGHVHVLLSRNILPDSYGTTFVVAVLLMLLGGACVIFLERKHNAKLIK